MSEIVTPIGVVPAWGRATIDEETLVLITLELNEWLEPDGVGADNHFKVDDSRAFQWLCREAAMLFQSLSDPTDKDFWEERDYTMALTDFCESLTFALLMEKDWINTKYWNMYGTETLNDFLTRMDYMDKIKEKFPK